MTRLRLRSPRRIRPTRGAYLRWLWKAVLVCGCVLLMLIIGFLVWYWFVMGA